MCRERPFQAADRRQRTSNRNREVLPKWSPHHIARRSIQESDGPTKVGAKCTSRECCTSNRDRSCGSFRERCGCVPPQPRGLRALAAAANTDAESVFFLFFQKASGAKVVEDLFASFVTVHAFVRAAILRDARLFIQNPQFRQVVALSYAVVIRIVRGGYFHSAGAKVRIDKFIGDDRDHAFEQREHKPAANGPAISLIRGIYGDGCIAEHRFGTRCGNGDITAVLKWITNVPEFAGALFMANFQIAHRGAATGTPIDDVGTAVNQAFFVKPRKNFEHRAGVFGVHREALARPVNGSAKALHLLTNPAAALLLPLPAAFEEFFPPHFEPPALALSSPRSQCSRTAFKFGKRLAPDLLLHNHLRSD